MRCSDENCNEKAVCKVLHMGEQEVFYCTPHANKYKAVMEAMGISPRFLTAPEDEPNA